MLTAMRIGRRIKPYDRLVIVSRLVVGAIEAFFLGVFRHVVDKRLSESIIAEVRMRATPYLVARDLVPEFTVDRLAREQIASEPMPQGVFDVLVVGRGIANGSTTRSAVMIDEFGMRASE